MPQHTIASDKTACLVPGVSRVIAERCTEFTVTLV